MPMTSPALDSASRLARLAPEAADPARVARVVADALAAGATAALATVVERQGSAPGTPGQKLVVVEGDRAFGTVGGGAVEKAVLAALVELVDGAREAPELRTFALGPELGMCCGGRLVVLLEPLLAPVPVLVVGAGHVATALAPVLARLGFAVTVADEREAWIDGRPELPGVTFVEGAFDEVGARVPTSGACLVMTHDHGLDQRVVEWALARGFAFVGGIGSRAKAERTRQRLAHKGVAEADRARVRMPLGVDVGARTPDEIAVSVAAELVQFRAARRRPSRKA